MFSLSIGAWSLIDVWQSEVDVSILQSNDGYPEQRLSVGVRSIAYEQDIERRNETRIDWRGRRVLLKNVRLNRCKEIVKCSPRSFKIDGHFRSSPKAPLPASFLLSDTFSRVHRCAATP